MFSLHDCKGPFPVGATTFSLPVRPSLTIGSAKLRNKNSPSLVKTHLQPALQLDEVAFTAYYPASTVNPDDSRPFVKGLDWLLRPIKQSLHGYVHFAGLPIWILWPVVYLFGVLLKIPVYPNAPLLHPASSDSPNSDHKSTPNRWPLVIFSHGLGGSRTAYSQLCSRLAASGKVVLALEHRDGTGHACVSRSWGTSGPPELKSILYLQEDDVVWDNDFTPSDPIAFALRTDQLAFRQHEIYIAYKAFSGLVQNTGDTELRTIDGSDIEWESWTGADRSRSTSLVKCEEDVSLVGHSFGGCTVFSILSTGPPSNDYPAIPITKALALDPWLEPLPSPGPVPYSIPILDAALPSELPSGRSSLDGTIDESGTVRPVQFKTNQTNPRMLVINSEGFTLWKDHFTRVQAVVGGWEPAGRRLLTLVRARHASFSDFPLLPVVRRKAAQTLMNVIGKLAVAFLDGKMEEGLKGVVTRRMEVEMMPGKGGKMKKRLVGDVGDAIIH